LKLLKFIQDKSVPKDGRYGKREAVRAVVFDDENLIPVLFVSKFNYHKLPGGGIEKSETKTEALAREILEETGCEAEIKGEIGRVEEYRSEFNLYQTSFFFWGKVIKKGKQKLEQKEIDEGFELVWLSLEEAVEKLKKDNPTNYEGKFIQERDLRLLEELKNPRIIEKMKEEGL